MKKIPQGILYLVTAVLFLVGAWILYWWTSSYTSWKLREQLQIISPLFLEIVFLLVIVACALNIKVFKRVFAKVGRSTWCLLALIVIGGSDHNHVCGAQGTSNLLR